ncbi:MAG TPA: MerR family transcriptional regulator [Rhodocyclaceae bacterium]|nr:MerR family transcriptional regulator [Rhodocyclaceae bacterium]
MLLRVGALARQTGLTVRTLHHYDEIGLLTPSHRSEAGYRLYTRDDVARLHQIQALKQLGFALADIAGTLASDGEALEDIVSRQLAALDQQIEQAARLRAQLLRMQEQMRRGEQPEMADWLLTLELMTMYEKYFTPDELQSLEQHKQRSGSDARWPAVITAMHELMERSTLPTDPSAQERIGEWMQLSEDMTGNDPGLMMKLRTMLSEEAALQEKMGMTPALRAYVMRCMQARQEALYAKYLTPAEVQRVMEGRNKIGEQWPPLVAAMRRRVEAGAGIHDAEVRKLAAQWQKLFDVTHQGDDGSLRLKLRAAYAQEPELLRATGLDLPLLEFVGRAMAAL